MSDIKVIADKNEIVAIADAVRSKTGSSENMDGLVGIANAVNEIGTASGGSLETCVIDIDCYMNQKIQHIFYINDTMNYTDFNMNGYGIAKLSHVAKGTLVVVTVEPQDGLDFYVEDSATIIHKSDSGDMACILADGDC